MVVQVPTLLATGIAASVVAILVPYFSAMLDSGDDALWRAGCGHLFMAFVTVLSVTLFHAPYGRYASETIVPVTVDTRAAWVLQEMPTLAAVSYRLSKVLQETNGEVMCYHWPMVVAFCAHYAHRTLIFPMFLRPSKPTPIHVMLLANIYCCFNGALQAKAMFSSSADRSCDPDPFFLAAGALVFAGGMFVNLSSDYTLINLRRASASSQSPPVPSAKKEYFIPRGFMFEYVSCPNFLGECIEWLGYAVIACSSGHPGVALAALSFACYTASNTVPRGVKHHQWYLNTFGSQYEKLRRKAVIPFIL